MIETSDPLSLYLFLLCTEGLINLLRNCGENEYVEGFKICRGAPRVNHLLFADDNVIFCKANLGTDKNIQVLLNNYEKALGQKINK